MTSLVVTKNRWGRSEHWYEHDGDLLPSQSCPNGKHLDPSVTGILKGGWPMPALTGWAHNTMAWHGIDSIDQLYAIIKAAPESSGEGAKFPTMGEQAAYEVLRSKLYASDEKSARQIGTDVHAAIAEGTDGGPTEKPYVDSYRAWLKESGAHVLAQEFPVWGDCKAGGYGGTVDLLIDLEPMGVGVVDIKTGKGVYEDAHAQVAAYAEAKDGFPHQPTWGGVLHVRPEKTELHLVDIPAAFDAFAAAYLVARYRGDLTPPETT